MNVFLTGDVGVGKSTVIDGALRRLGLKAGGFRTFFGEDRDSPDRFLYMGDANREKPRPAAWFENDRVTAVRLDTFNQYGAGLIYTGLRDSQILLMDEIGRLEWQAEVFQEAVLSALDSDVPILGVLRQGVGGWLNQIRAHRQTRELTVTAENRDHLPLELERLLG